LTVPSALAGGPLALASGFAWRGSAEFFAAAEAEAKEARLRKEADDAKKAAEADHKAVAAAAEGMARNPAASASIRFALLLGLVLIESLALYTLVIIFVKVG